MNSVTRPAGLGGLRHVALYVKNFDACEHFYVELLGMAVEWRPDPDNLYLSSGCDNLAVHRANAGEPQGASDAWDSKHAGKIIPQLNPQTIADGLRTSLGDKTWPIIRDHVERIVLVSEEEIVAALRLLLERMKIVVEPSGAVALAAILKEKKAVAGKRVGIILSGGNVDLKTLGAFFG